MISSNLVAARRRRTIRSLRALLALAVPFALLSSACGGGDDDDTTAPPPPPSGVWVVPVVSSTDCTALRCATAIWDAARGVCTVTALRPGCTCFEGQTQSCDTTTRNLCSPGSTTCGVRYCVVTNTGSAAVSAWERPCHAF